MEPNKFRESRQEINRMCENINQLIEQKDLEASKACYEEVSTHLDALTPEAEGEIQERSVKNLGVKINGLSASISKLKPKKKPAGKRKQAGTKIAVVWDEERVGQLSIGFLKKLFANMGDDTNASVCFGTTGKGIRPGYQIKFDNDDNIAYSGSGHSPLKNQSTGTDKKISKPFSYAVIDSILTNKK